MRLSTLTALLSVLGLLPAACAPADVTVEESSDAAPVAEEAADDTADDQTAQRTTSPVTWHPQSGEEGEVTDAEATLYTTEWGSSVSFETGDLEPGHVYTLWWIVVNEPAACEAHPEPCTGKDVFADGNPAKAQVSYVAGNVADDNGETTFSAHVTPGPIADGWLPDQGFTDLWGAEHHFTVNDHGPLVAEHMPDMLHSYRGGCSDDSPFPEIFPDAALDDGQPGPNECLLTQSAVLQQ